MKLRVRQVTFMGTKAYPQGVGMTWDDIDPVVDLAPGESIAQVEYGVAFCPVGGVPDMMDGEVPYYRIWIQTPIAESEHT